MSLEIIPIGGYSEIGRNCTLVKINNESIILDFGLLMDKYIEITEERDDITKVSGRRLIEHGAAPDINIIKKEKTKVQGIIVSHAHLDHIGAIPYLANKFNCDIHGTPFTIEVLKKILNEDKVTLKNELKSHPPNSKFKISKNITVEFIYATHSIPHTAIIVIHTPEGKIMYANDFKLDNAPTLGPKTNTKRIKELQGKIDVLIMDSLYASTDKKSPSEAIAREMLKDVLLGVNNTGRILIVTTFSSHIARLKTITEIAEKLGRKPVMLGRSLAKYVEAATNTNITNLNEKCEIIPYSKKVPSYLKKIKDYSKYLFITTGHQGEPNAMLSKIVDKKLLPLRDEDHVVFSCNIIPVPINIENRIRLEEKLKHKHVRIFKDIHVSGHAMREDHRDLINMVKPTHIIPTHGMPTELHAAKELAIELGYDPDKIHILHNGEKVKIK